MCSSDLESLAEAQRWYAALEPHAEVVLGAQTVLLKGEPSALRSLVHHTTPAPVTGLSGHPTLEIPVTYDGADLDEVAAHTGLSVQEVIEAHIDSDWIVAFGGFAPGFAYLTGGDPRLVVPRRDSPRASVPAGSVGLAGAFSGIYPRESPGGWQLLGHTDLAMWDLDRDPPALLLPGRTIRFVVVL